MQPPLVLQVEQAKATSPKVSWEGNLIHFPGIKQCSPNSRHQEQFGILFSISFLTFLPKLEP